MANRSSRTSSQFVFVLFVALTLALGVILTTGKATLSPFSFAQTSVNYCRKEGICGRDSDCCSGYYCAFTDAYYECKKDFAYTKCDNSNVYSCYGNKCKLQYVCKFGCVPSDSQNNFEPGGAEAKCVDKKTKTYLKCENDGNIWSCSITALNCKLKERCGSAGCIGGINYPRCAPTSPTATPKPVPTLPFVRL